MRLRVLLAAALLSTLLASEVSAQRRYEVRFSVTRRAQIALWIESADGSRFATLRLTDSVAFRGIGNRPGALMMNSGRHWPYGRREGVLPIWAHRRYDFEGDHFRRVIFDGRRSEGDASSASSASEPSNTRDSWFCLSFDMANNDIELGEDAFDVMTCNSIFLSNKGRYLTPEDLALGYAEPWEETAGVGSMRMLDLVSLYPPRRDLPPCPSGLCGESADARGYAADARTVMPEIDVVSMATPAEGADVVVPITVPDEWPDGDYVVYLEVNVEGDYAPGWDTTSHPTPRTPTGRWDFWAMSYGYPYRGQPSVLYEVPVTITSGGGEFTTSIAAGYGDLHGASGDVTPMDATIMNDSAAHPGSGVDRVFADETGARVRVTVPAWDVCAQEEAPIECGQECNAERPCGSDMLACGEGYTCVDRCEVVVSMPAPGEIALTRWPEARHTHEWAHLRFTVPEIPRGILGWEIRVGTDAITDDGSFTLARQARAATGRDEALDIPTRRADGSPLAPGDVIELDLGGLSPETTYHVGVRVIDDCTRRSAIATAEITTTAIQFTTVSPCFVATAAFGSPLDARIGVLRRFRDRSLLSNDLGRALVGVYETVGPIAADLLREDDDARALVAALLTPIVSLLETLE